MPNREPVDCIIPTMDNMRQLQECVYSLYCSRAEHPVRILIVNNGECSLESAFPDIIGKGVEIISPGKNLGWTGGLREGLKHSTSRYVAFSNDDIYLPRSSGRAIRNLARVLDVYPWVGAIGPTSNVVMGTQNIWAQVGFADYEVSFLIGFFMLLRREALEKAGGIQDMESGGDDIDLSIRIRKAGYGLIVKREEFVYHHGFQTGERVHGRPDKPGGWNSREMIDATNAELIRKHGFLTWWETMCFSTLSSGSQSSLIEEPETKVISKYVNGGIVVELGCGHRKTVPQAIGVDIVPKGEMIPYMNEVSVADVTADVSGDLPFVDNYADTIIARHVFEHCLDTVQTLRNWKQTLKTGGRLIITCPDERIRDGVPINPQHVHGFTAESVVNLGELVGFKSVAVERDYNDISFTAVLERVN